MLTVYLMRHGQSQANVERIFANGDDGYPLTEEGRAQAALAAELLALKNIKRIYTSPILRAKQSAAIVEKRLGIEPVVLDEIREFSVGELEGQFISGEAESAFMRLMIQWISGNSSDKIPNGESHLEIMARMKKAIDII
ncbi:MAG: histidine phosphatase family protein, partial [Thermotogaceae bacterium]|nr:histidine phosphatase family protein [Thermotogaceae bacterium]